MKRIALALSLLVACTCTASALVYRTNVLADSPLVYLPFDETTGTSAGNLGTLGGTHDGTFVNGPGLGEVGPITGDPVNNAIRLTSSTDRVTINSAVTAASFSGDNNYSVEFWFNPDALANNRDLVSATGPGHGILIEQQGTDNLRFLHRSPSGNSGGQNINPSSQIVQLDWNHAVAVVDGGQMELYLNGIPHGTGPTVSNPINFNLNFVLGQLSPTNTGRQYEGLIDEFALYGTALSAGQVLTHFNSAALSPVGAVPEPSSVISMVTVMIGVMAVRRRKRRQTRA